MEKLIFLGTGNGTVTDCYNTCFILQNNDKNILVDAGGGNGILTQLKKANIKTESIHDVIISHNHMDHLIGLFWVMRDVARLMNLGKYDGVLNIYCHKSIKDISIPFLDAVFPHQWIKGYKERTFFHNIEDQQERVIGDYKIKFMNLYENKGLQFGFKTRLNNNETLAFLGDIPCDEKLYPDLADIDWFIHEAYCLYNEAEKYDAYNKGHGTVKETSQIAQQLNVKNLVLQHLQDNDLPNRKKLYTKESKEYFTGNVFVPNDLETIEL